MSQRAEQPRRRFRGVSECQARGLSVFEKKEDCARAAKLPSLRGRSICGVELDQGAGRILQTGQGSHHTWWPFADFRIVDSCVENMS